MLGVVDGISSLRGSVVLSDGTAEFPLFLLLKSIFLILRPNLGVLGLSSAELDSVELRSGAAGVDVAVAGLILLSVFLNFEMCILGADDGVSDVLSLVSAGISVVGFLHRFFLNLFFLFRIFSSQSDTSGFGFSSFGSDSTLVSSSFSTGSWCLRRRLSLLLAGEANTTP